MDQQPLITIIVPVYNVEPYLRKCLDSIVHQTYSNLEIILIDDGSPDQCGQICDEYAAQDNRVIVIHQENKGGATARNRGLKRAKGDYIGFVDADDWIDFDQFATLLENIQKYETDVAICEFRKIYPDRVVDRPAGSTEVISSHDAIYYHLTSSKQYQIINAPWNKLFKRSVLEQVRYPDGFFHEDLLFNIEALLRCKTCAYVRATKYNYVVVREGSTTSKPFTDRKITNTIPLLKKRLALLEEQGYKDLHAIALGKYAETLLGYYDKVRKTKIENQEAMIQLVVREINELPVTYLKLGLMSKVQMAWIKARFRQKPTKFMQ